MLTINEGAGNLRATDLSTGAEALKQTGELVDAVERFVAFGEKSMRDDQAAAAADYEEARMILIGGIAVAVIVAVAAAAWMAISISTGLSRAVRLAVAVSAGDLTQTIEAKGNDEIGDLTRALRDRCDKLRSGSTDGPFQCWARTSARKSSRRRGAPSIRSS